MFRRPVVASVAWLLLLAPTVLRAEECYFDSGGVKIHYVVEGKGEPVLLVHGFAANIYFQWGMPGILKTLAKDYQVIAMDCRGHGQSGKPHDPRMYGMEVVEDLVRLLDHLKIRKAHVVGYSLGAFITLKLITTHPDRLLSATLGGGGWTKTIDTHFQDELAESLEQGKGIRPLLLMLNPPGRPKPTEEQLRLASLLLAAVNDIKALVAATRGLRAVFTISAEDLQRCKVPTLSIIGDLDPFQKGVDDLKGELRDFKVIVIPGADHMNTFWRPEFLRGVKEFLRTHPAEQTETPGCCP
ncbi:MAG TPA: alpha/beta hydrolase [Gemmataceae bacterium]|nr:alpha/beta hydrolase [Gemmataceae bacterium]